MALAIPIWIDFSKKTLKHRVLFCYTRYMTKRGGGSHRRRFSILVVSILMLTATFLLPFSAHAEDVTPPEAVEAPLLSFTATDAYLVQATHVSLRAPLGTSAVEFSIGDQRIPGIRETPQTPVQEPATFEIWHPSDQPAASGVMQAHIVGNEDATAQIVLHDLLVPRIAQVGDSLEVHGTTTGSVLPGTTLALTFNGGAPQAVDCTAGCGADTLLATLPLANVVAGEYTAQLQFTDTSGELGSTTSAPATVSWPAKSDIDNVIIPVAKPQVYVDKLEVVPIGSLSTQFSTPVSPKLVEAISSTDSLQLAAAPLESDVKGAATAQSNPLRITSLDTTPNIPVAPSDGGWAVLGIAWYWWASGGLAAWAGVVAARWWLR